METERTRLLELLEKAETVEDIITIESRLSEVNYQLESYTSRLRTYDNLIDYSTVQIHIREVDRETKAEPKGFWEEVADEFGNSTYELGQDIRGFAVWFLGSSPYVLMWAVIIAALILILKMIKRKRAMKRILLKTEPEKEDITDSQNE